MHCLLWNLAPDGFIYKSMIKQIFSQVLEDCISVWNYMTWYLSTLFSSPERSEWNPQKVPRHLAINLTVNYMLTAMCNKLTHWIQVTGCLTMKKKKLVKRQLTGITLHEKLWPREGDWLIRSLRSALALFPPVNIGGVYHSCAMPERALTPWRILQQSVGTNSSLPLLKARKVYYKKIEKNIQIPYVVIMEMSGCVTEKVHLLMGAPSVILNVSGSSQSWLLNGKNRSMGNVKLLSSPCSCL